MTRPTNCNKCQTEFYQRPLLQAKARHYALKLGAATAQAMVDEELEVCHDEHGTRETVNG